jgi:hypothetical protein
LATDSKREIKLLRVSCDISSISKSVNNKEVGLAAGVVWCMLVRVAETSLVSFFKVFISSEVVLSKNEN